MSAWISPPAGTDPFADNPRSDLTDIEFTVLRRWLLEAARLLGLGQWRIYLSAHQADKAVVASSYLRDRANESWVAVAKGWRNAVERDRRHSLTHELLHCWYQPVTRMAELLVERELGNRTEAVIEAAISEIEERQIDSLAWAISALLPQITEG